jgi:hypothetical protein
MKYVCYSSRRNGSRRSPSINQGVSLTGTRRGIAALYIRKHIHIKNKGSFPLAKIRLDSEKFCHDFHLKGDTLILATINHKGEVDRYRIENLYLNPYDTEVLITIEMRKLFPQDGAEKHDIYYSFLHFVIKKGCTVGLEYIGKQGHITPPQFWDIRPGFLI